MSERPCKSALKKSIERPQIDRSKEDSDLDSLRELADFETLYETGN